MSQPGTPQLLLGVTSEALLSWRSRETLVARSQQKMQAQARARLALGPAQGQQ